MMLAAILLTIIHLSFDDYSADVLYVRLGHDVQWKRTIHQLIGNDSTCEDSRTYSEMVGHVFLMEKGLSANTSIQVLVAPL